MNHKKTKQCLTKQKVVTKKKISAWQPQHCTVQQHVNKVPGILYDLSHQEPCIDRNDTRYCYTSSVNRLTWKHLLRATNDSFLWFHSHCLTQQVNTEIHKQWQHTSRCNLCSIRGDEYYNNLRLNFSGRPSSHSMWCDISFSLLWSIFSSPIPPLPVSYLVM